MIPSVKVRYEDRHGGRVAFVCIDRPEKLNSLSAEIMRAFTDLFHGLAADLRLRAVVLPGDPRRAGPGDRPDQRLLPGRGPGDGRGL
jgi:enoyl-CoA hydratase